MGKMGGNCATCTEPTCSLAGASLETLEKLMRALTDLPALAQSDTKVEIVVVGPDGIRKSAGFVTTGSSITTDKEPKQH